MTATAIQDTRAAGDDRLHPDDEGIWQALFELVLGSDLADQLDAIAFEVRDGRVLLTGELRTWRDIPRLIRLAWQPSGVTEVEEFLHWSGESEDESDLLHRLELRHRLAAG